MSSLNLIRAYSNCRVKVRKPSEPIPLLAGPSAFLLFVVPVRPWGSEMNMVLGELKIEEKSNEITAIPELLDL